MEGVPCVIWSDSACMHEGHCPARLKCRYQLATSSVFTNAKLSTVYMPWVRGGCLVYIFRACHVLAVYSIMEDIQNQLPSRSYHVPRALFRLLWIRVSRGAGLIALQCVELTWVHLPAIRIPWWGNSWYALDHVHYITYVCMSLYSQLADTTIASIYVAAGCPLDSQLQCLHTEGSISS